MLGLSQATQVVSLSRMLVRLSHGLGSKPRGLNGGPRLGEVLVEYLLLGGGENSARRVEIGCVGLSRARKIKWRIHFPPPATMSREWLGRPGTASTNDARGDPADDDDRQQGGNGGGDHDTLRKTATSLVINMSTVGDLTT